MRCARTAGSLSPTSLLINHRKRALRCHRRQTLRFDRVPANDWLGIKVSSVAKSVGRYGIGILYRASSEAARTTAIGANSSSAPTTISPMPAPFMGAQDFSYVLQRMPGCMMFLGVMPEGHGDHDPVASCHSNHMILNEDAMAVGIGMHAAIAHRFLTEHLPG